MDYEQARYHLQLHAGVLDEARREWVLDDGFLVSLRPYSGLREKNFHLVMEALLTVGEQMYREPQIDRDLMHTIWSLCSYARLWGLHPDGMLQRNNLITDADARRLERWVDAVEQTALHLLQGSPPHQAVYHYAEYVVADRCWDNIGFFIPLMQRAVAAPEPFAGTMILRALGKLGSSAKPVLPALYEALTRIDSWDDPGFETTPSNFDHIKEGHRAEIRDAIAAIEGGDGQ
jgi:hypothetical protein